MGVPREDLLLMMRALKRGVADLKSIRKALDRQVSKPISLLEALHLPGPQAEVLKVDTSLPDPGEDRALLDSLHAMLIEGEQLTSAEWEKFAASISRPTVRKGYAALPVPQEFDGYTLQWELARRERGVVYRAKDREGRDVAVKVFRKEVPATGLPLVEGYSYAVSEFVDGESLEAKRPSARRGAHAIWNAAELLRDRAHGALSPSRIVIRKDDTAAVLGLESAKAVPPSSRARAYAGASDVHALGAILYEVIVGSPPAGETSPKARVKDVDENLDRIVACALTGGYPTTGALADDLGHYFKGEPITGRKMSSGSAGGKPRSRLWLAAAAAVPVAALLIWLLVPKSKPVETPPADPVVRDEKPAPPPTRAADPKPPKETVKAPPRPAIPAAPMTPDEEQKLCDQCVEAQMKGDSDRVQATATEAIARGTKRDWPYYQLATLFLSRNELDKALQYVSRALEISPDNRYALETRAHTYIYRGETKKALADLESLYGKKVSNWNHQIVALSKEAEADAKDPRPRFLRGVFFMIKRNFETAATDFTAAIDAGQRRALVWRALAFQGADDTARAIQDVNAYLAAYPNDFATEDMKALLKELQGKK
jgi:tetratricopeptide (TPR) repeat protein